MISVMHVIGDRQRRLWRRHLGLVLGGGAIAVCAFTAE